MSLQLSEGEGNVKFPVGFVCVCVFLLGFLDFWGGRRGGEKGGVRFCGCEVFLFVSFKEK